MIYPLSFPIFIIIKLFNYCNDLSYYCYIFETSLVYGSFCIVSYLVLYSILAIFFVKLSIESSHLQLPNLFCVALANLFRTTRSYSHIVSHSTPYIYLIVFINYVLIREINVWYFLLYFYLYLYTCIFIAICICFKLIFLSYVLNTEVIILPYSCILLQLYIRMFMAHAHLTELCSKPDTDTDKVHKAPSYTQRTASVRPLIFVIKHIIHIFSSFTVQNGYY